jgi:hypothetical protein
VHVTVASPASLRGRVSSGTFHERNT